MMRSILLLVGMMSSQFLLASNCEFQSGVRQTSLLELYTSEGCSSCPPADKWISSLKKDSRLWKEIVPIVFHVDYWDYLGWKDQLASNRYSLRQRNFRLNGFASSVYTPGFFLNGREWRQWYYSGKLNSKLKKMPGSLKVVMSKNNIEVNFKASSEGKVSKLNEVWLHVAYLGAGINSKVKAGENSGKSLAHDFAVLKHEKKKVKMSKANIWTMKRSSQFKLYPMKALAVWISEINDPTPIQAAGAWCAG